MANPFLNQAQVTDAEVLKLLLESAALDVQQANLPSGHPSKTVVSARKTQVTSQIANHK